MSDVEKQLTQLLAEYPRFERAMLFGLQASGKVSTESHVDLALLLADTPCPASFSRS